MQLLIRGILVDLHLMTKENVQAQLFSPLNMKMLKIQGMLYLHLSLHTSFKTMKSLENTQVIMDLEFDVLRIQMCMLGAGTTFYVCLSPFEIDFFILYFAQYVTSCTLFIWNTSNHHFVLLVASGFPSLGVEWQKMENPDLRKAMGMEPDQKGVRIRRIEPTSPEFLCLKPSDIILSFDGVDIANDGTGIGSHLMILCLIISLYYIRMCKLSII